MTATVSDCVFCARVEAGEYDDADPFAVSFRPLKPVGPGHRLFVPRAHVADALEDPNVTAMTARFAADWARRAGVGPCNLITSRGPEATQSVGHLHWHLVPRLKGDGLPLPWTGQGERQEPMFGELDEHLRPADFSGHDMWHIAAYLPEGREEEVFTWLAVHGISVYRAYQSGELLRELKMLPGRAGDKPPAVRLLEEALFLRQNGERAPGGNETWHDWDLRAERFLRSLLPEPDAAP